MKFKFFSLLVLVSLMVASGVFFKANVAFASCDPSSDPQIDPTINSIDQPTGTYNSPVTIGITISGTLSYSCEGTAGFGYQDTATRVDYTITNNSTGAQMYFQTWHSPFCNNPLACWEGPYTATDNVNVSSWPAGTYTIRASVYNDTTLNTHGGLPADTKSGNFTITGVSNMSGTLTATDCIIPSGASTCNTNLNWTTTNPVGTSEVTTPTNVTVGTGNFGSATYPITYGSDRYFFLYNNDTKLTEKNPTATCETGTIFNGTICSTGPMPTGTISVGNCDTTTNPFQTLISWTTSNLVSGGTTEVTHNNPDNVHVSYLSSNPIPTSVPIISGLTTFYLYHNNLQLASASVTCSDGSGSFWAQTGSGTCDDPFVWHCMPTVGTCNNDHTEGQVVPPNNCGVAKCSNPAIHYSCSVGDPGAIHSGISTFTWTCTQGATSASCSEIKKKPIYKEN
ncbi:MAG: hypothetical protein KGL67_00265 [Patescibacteria group bacterium]|nr:hypothetical protein [Patescibacteria group bacterium]